MICKVKALHQYLREEGWDILAETDKRGKYNCESWAFHYEKCSLSYSHIQDMHPLSKNHRLHLKIVGEKKNLEDAIKKLETNCDFLKRFKTDF